MNDAPDYAAVTEAQQKVWSEGDFAMVAGLVNFGAENLAEALDIVAGERCLDVACGSGNLALAMARRAWGNTVGADFVPALLERGRERAAAERLEVEFVEADAQDLPFEDASFDVAASIFGAMFAPDQERTAAELLRVVKPGGRIGMANWTPDGGVGALFMTIAKHTGGPPPGVMPPALWGVEERIRELFGDGVSSLSLERAQITPGIPLGRPLPRLLPRLLRADQARLRESRAGGRGGPDRRPARLSRRVQHRGRPRAGGRAGIHAAGRDPGLSAAQLFGATTRSAAPISSTVKKTRPATGPPCPRA